MPKKQVTEINDQILRISKKGPRGSRRLLRLTEAKNPAAITKAIKVMEALAAMVSPEGLAVHRISVYRFFYEEEKPTNILYAVGSLQLAKEHGFDVPLWALHAVEDCYADIVNIRVEKKYAGYALLKAFKIKDARAFKRFQERKRLFDAYLEVKIMVSEGKSITAARNEIAKSYPDLGTADTLRNKFNRLKEIFTRDKPLPDPFSA